MDDGYAIFRKFPTEEQAIELKELLEENNLKVQLGNNLPPVDVTFSGSTLLNEYEVRLSPLYFKQAEAILEDQAKNLIDTVDKDYYLLDFTNEELYDILLKADEWNVYDYTLAQQLLKQRGKSIDKDLLNSLRTERNKQLAKPEGNQRPWIIVGYFLALVGGFLGLIIGYFLWTSKKTLPNGQKVYSYSPIDRFHGKLIFYISLVVFPTMVYLRLFTELGKWIN